MSYELDHVQKECLCPCGKGKIVFGWGTNDWNQVREGMTEIWCSDCSRNYKFSKGGLLPISYPDYMGDENAYEKMRKLHDIINNYCGFHAFRYWSKELRNKRIHQYLTDEEIEEDKNNGKHNLVMALGFAKDLADQFSLEELKTIQSQLLEAKYSTELKGNAKAVAEMHRRYYKSVKVSKILVPVNMAVRNYEYYKQAELEDEKFLNEKRKELNEIEAVYYKDYPEYEKNRVNSLIHYELIDISR